MPTARADVVKVALSLATVPVPRVVVPSLKVTVPLGNPPNAPVMVAVKVTGVPLVEGFFDDTSPVLVDALKTFWINAAEAPARKSAFPA